LEGAWIRSFRTTDASGVQEQLREQYDAIWPAEQVCGGLQRADDEWNPGR
jgi:hypothetical protein